MCSKPPKFQFWMKHTTSSTTLTHPFLNSGSLTNSPSHISSVILFRWCSCHFTFLLHFTSPIDTTRFSLSPFFSFHVNVFVFSLNFHNTYIYIYFTYRYQICIPFCLFLLLLTLCGSLMLSLSSFNPLAFDTEGNKYSSFSLLSSCFMRV